jgi:hypothetical protein
VGGLARKCFFEHGCCCKYAAAGHCSVSGASVSRVLLLPTKYSRRRVGVQQAGLLDARGAIRGIGCCALASRCSHGSRCQGSALVPDYASGSLPSRKVPDFVANSFFIMVTWNSTSLPKQVTVDRGVITKELGLLRAPLPRQSPTRYHPSGDLHCRTLIFIPGSYPVLPPHQKDKTGVRKRGVTSR